MVILIAFIHRSFIVYIFFLHKIFLLKYFPKLIIHILHYYYYLINVLIIIIIIFSIFFFCANVCKKSFNKIKDLKKKILMYCFY